MATGESDDPLALAGRADLRVGATTIRPSTRSLAAAGGSARIEPRVMQVLLALVDAQGTVRTREQLERLCWGGQIVGEDALNRAMFELRRALRAIAADFGIETIPRVGYRLIETAKASPPEPAEVAVAPAASSESRGLSRRLVIGGGAMAVLGGGFVALRYRERSHDDRIAQLLDQGRQALRDELPDAGAEGVGALKQAAALDPGNAAAWGLLALAYRNMSENADPADISAAASACEAAAKKALAIDPREGNALAALATLQPYYGDWLASEDRIRAVLAVAPDNAAAINHLVTLLQSVGRDRASWDWNERAAAIEPSSPVPLYRRALKLWIFGDVAAADRVIDRALQRWPRHPAVWNARLLIFAFSGRPRAALAMIEDKASRPAAFGGKAIEQWRGSLAALDTRSARDVAAARATNLTLTALSPGFAFNAMMILSALGELDAAFAVTEGLLLRRGPLVVTLWTGNGQMPVNDQRWRRTMPMFTPATAAMRADPRFDALCREIGLTAYWRARGVTPDYRKDRT